MGKLGINAKLYWRSGGSYEAPTWTEVTIIADLAVNPAWDDSPADDRSSRVKRRMKTVLGLEFSGRMKKKPGNTAYEAFMNALLSDDALDLLVMDGDKDVANNRGWRCDCQVFSGNEDQAMANVLYEDIILAPTDSDNTPKAVKATGGGTLTYSTPGVLGGTFA